ncbi:MAG TPA: lipocalin family protein [Rhodocyclaceae bacterium]|nr:lipocalin family protein [Rhodocyclaceae bacterium]
MRNLLLLLLMSAAAGAAADPAVRSVQEVDLARYAGKWYEIARYPMFFQRNCLGDVTAQYTPLADDCISVTNRCRTDSGVDEANGKACTVPGTNNAQLHVSFFWPFRSDYWIIGLDPGYRWAVVGRPDHKYLWILSRTPQLPKEQLDQALKIAADQGYDVGQLKYTQQSGQNP